jgi:hypothetical protein
LVAFWQRYQATAVDDLAIADGGGVAIALAPLLLFGLAQA